MPDISDRRTEAREQPRLKVPAMYTLLRVRPLGSSRYNWTGYIYDISVSGMRFELDSPLDPGTEVEVRGMLPGNRHVTFRATGKVIRLHDDEHHGPVRMGMTFDSFAQSIDRQRLCDYLTDFGLKAA